MKSIKIACLPLVMITASCSSAYDVWQGYEDIEPPVISQEYKKPTTTRGELDEVVSNSIIENNFIQSDRDPQDIEEIEEIKKEELADVYEMAEKQSAADLVAKIDEVDLSHLISTEKPMAIVEQDAVVVNPEFIPLVVSEDTTFLQPDEMADISETIIIGEVASEEIETEVATEIDTYSSDNSDESSISFLANQIKYNKGSTRLSPNDMKILKSVAGEYKKNPAKVSVVGYAINRDADLSVDKAMELMDLATARADKVSAALQNLGVNASDTTVSAQALDASPGNTVAKGDVTEIYFEY